MNERRYVELLLAKTQRFEGRSDMFEMNIERAQTIDFRRWKPRDDLGFAFCVFGKGPLAFPCFHRCALDGFICSFALRTRARQCE